MCKGTSTLTPLFSSISLAQYRANKTTVDDLQEQGTTKCKHLDYIHTPYFYISIRENNFVPQINAQENQQEYDNKSPQSRVQESHHIGKNIILKCY